MGKSPYLSDSDLTALALEGGYSSIVSLSQLSNITLLSSILFLRQKWIWENPIAPITDSEFETINAQLDQTEYELMSSFSIGMILPSVVPIVSQNLLQLDGTVVLQSDYPELALVAPATWLSGADIVLPDMNNHAIFGAGGDNQLGRPVGANLVTLDISEIPSHNHTQNPHNHTEVIPVVTPTAAGLEPLLADITVPTPSLTGFATATNNPTGGGGSHNNIPRSIQVYYYIVAR